MSGEQGTTPGLGVRGALVAAVFGLALLAALGNAWLRRGREARLERLPAVTKLSDFSLLDRSGQTRRLLDLKGRASVVGFVFTRCSGPCPRLTATMAALHADPGLRELRLISVTVDPEHDRPEQLDAYARSFAARAGDWWFLTGEAKAVRALVRQSFKLALMEDERAGTPVGERFSHSTRLVLVDDLGQIRGYYDSTDGAELKKLRADALALIRAGRAGAR